MESKIKVYMLGDSTVSPFNDTSYFYPRYGYGTQMKCFLNDKVEVINLALSGRSSKSYIKEENYQIFKKSLNTGDYVFIGFGHNDQKSDDISRFTNASLDINNPNSFKYSLYNNYIKYILEKGAIPILCTPICRITKDELYEGNIIHETINGSYKNSIIELGNELNVLVIDLTTPTILDSKEGFYKAIYYHAMTNGKLVDGKLVCDPKSVDKTHLNSYGAKVVAYYILSKIKESNLLLKDHIINLKRPSIDELKMNPEFKLSLYEIPNYNTKDEVFYIDIDGFKSSIFGNIGTTNLKEDGYTISYDEIDKSFTIGQIGNKILGGICATSDTICGVFKQIPLNFNFSINLRCKVEKLDYKEQSSFGIMLRDDMYLNQKVSKVICASNFVVAGILTDSASYTVNYKRESTTEISRFKNNVLDIYQEGDIFNIYLERLGQRIILRVSNDKVTYENECLDFDLQAIDNKYMYLGLFACKGIIVKYFDIDFKLNGNAMEA